MKITVKSFVGKEEGRPFIAKDGASVFELFKNSGLDIKNISIASGYLKPMQKAFPHYHQNSEEIYYVIKGRGKIKIDDSEEEIGEEDAIFIPVNAVHALINTSRTLNMKILAICSPPYKDDDIFFVE